VNKIVVLATRRLGNGYKGPYFHSSRFLTWV
jgi:hypothetical protein